MSSDYSSTELLTTVAASLLEDESTIMVGTGMPLLASMLAQRTHAPDATLIFEAGGIGAESPALPVSVGDEHREEGGVRGGQGEKAPGEVGAQQDARGPGGIAEVDRLAHMPEEDGRRLRLPLDPVVASRRGRGREGRQDQRCQEHQAHGDGFLRGQQDVPAVLGGWDEAESWIPRYRSATSLPGRARRGGRERS